MAPPRRPLSLVPAALLLAGLQRAREAALDSEPWGEDLLAKWEHAIEEYAMR